MKRRNASSAVLKEVYTKKHKIGYNPAWKSECPWIQLVHGGGESTVVGTMCSICQRHGTKQQNGIGNLAHFLGRILCSGTRCLAGIEKLKS